MQTVLIAPLIGTSFEADSREVHQIIVASTTGTDSEQFLKSVAKYECGRPDMNIIRAFYKGTGVNNRRMLEAKQSLNIYIYNNESTMPYFSFVAKLNGIFQVLSDEGQEKEEAKKIVLKTNVFTPTTFQYSQRHSTVDASSLSDRWGCSGRINSQSHYSEISKISFITPCLSI